MEFPEAKKEKDIIIRSLFSEAMHFCSVLPFHLAYDGKEEIGLALYLVGTMLLNNIYPFDGDLLYNINNLEDYLNLIDAIK